MHHRRSLRRWLRDEPLANRIAADFESADLDARRLAMLRFASKLTTTPGDMTRDDVAALKAAGFADADVLHIVQVTAYFNFVNRLADGLGVELEPWTPAD